LSAPSQPQGHLFHWLAPIGYRGWRRELKISLGSLTHDLAQLFVEPLSYATQAPGVNVAIDPWQGEIYEAALARQPCHARLSA
jgi:hypothetical protein